MANFDMSAHVRRINRQDRIATGVLVSIAAFVMLMLAAIVTYILVAGAPKLFDLNFLTGKPQQFKEGGGIGPELFNSFYLLVLTLLISVPLSLGAAIFLSQYAPDNAITAVALTMFNIPILVRVIQQALEDVPRSQRDAGLAMGLTRWETTIHVLLPAAMPAIVTGVVLSAGRVFGEAAALIFTAGQSAPVLDFTCLDFSSPSCPWNVFRPAETLAVHIWKINSEGVVPDLTAISNGTAAVLMVCILAFNILARVIGKYLERRLTSE